MTVHSKSAHNFLVCAGLLLAGTLIQAFGVCNIHAHAPVTEGGVIGLSLLLEHLTGLSPAVSSLILNLACFLFGLRQLGKHFLVCTLLSFLGYSVFYALLEPWAPLLPCLISHPAVSALTGAVFVGIGAGLCVRAGGATTGDDALAMGIQHRFGVDVRWVYLCSDGLVLCLSLSYIPLRTILWSLLTVILSGQIIGWIQKIPAHEKRRS